MNVVNIKPSQLYPVKDHILPQSVAAAASVSSGWIDASQQDWLSILALCGAGAGTVAIKVEQADSSVGGNAKDLYTAVQTGITVLDTTIKKQQADLQLGANLDVDANFRWIRITATVTGGAGTLISAGAQLGPSRYLA